MGGFWGIPELNYQWNGLKTMVNSAGKNGVSAPLSNCKHHPRRIKRLDYL